MESRFPMMVRRLQAIDRLLRISERRSRLLGLDAPVRTRVGTITLDAIESEIERLERELAGYAGDGDADA